MSALGYIAAVGGLASFGLLIGVFVMKLRIDGLHRKVRKANRGEDVAIAALKVSVKEQADFKMKSDAVRARLRAELERYEDEELDEIESTEEMQARIARRRAFISRMFSETSDGDSGDSDDELHSGSET